MLPMEDELIQVFCLIDDQLKALNFKEHHHSRFTGSEVITIGVLKELWKLRTLKAIWRLIRDQFQSFFPSTHFIQSFSQATKAFGPYHETDIICIGSKK